MSSSPSSVKSRPPKRTSPAARTPLRERTQSQANELSARLSRDALSDQENYTIYNTTPFPTKPAHILLPSSIKKKKSTPNVGGDVFSDSPFVTEAERSNGTQRSLRGSPQPTVRLKRSVKALRDLYEAQADEASSPPPRPSTASSSRLRSIGSNESLSGVYARESARKISSDDLALLPTLPAGARPARRLSTRSSFTSIAGRVAATSSPNYRVLGVTSSPRPPADLSSSGLDSLTAADPSISTIHDGSSSPNVVRLAHTSSTDQFPDILDSSSPNVVKLGTSSPFASHPAPAHFATTISRSSSSLSLKRKRSETLESRSFADRAGARNPLASSPPLSRDIPTSAAASIVSPESRGFESSAPQSIRQVEDSFDDSSPVVRRLGSSQFSSDDLSLADSHASLQAALSSSPPRIQYPVVRAPPRSQQVGLVVPKRNSRSLSAERAGPSLPSRLSAIPSEASRANTRPTSVTSSVLDEIDDYLTSDELAPASIYIINEPSIKSQIRIVRDDDVDSHEATDEVSALPSSDDVYKSPSVRPSRSGSYIGSTDSSLSRLNSMRSLTNLRQNTFHSPLLRPTSSASSVTKALPLPTWAKRYYSGVYADSFQYLYASTSHLDLHNLASPSQRALPAPSRPTTSNSNGSPSRRSFHQAMTERMEALFKARTRPRLEARKSHTLPGVGPLVSNPLRGPATAALEARRQSYPSLPPASSRARSISAPLSAVDPRAHWAGVMEIYEQPLEDGPGSTYTIHHHHYRRPSNGYSITPSESQLSVVHYPAQNLHRWSASPHLHHDQRLNTGSSVSRGFGFPFNARSRWAAPSIASQSSGFFASRADLRTTQVACFAIGFVVPLTWFVAAFLPLPKRPLPYADLEKQAYRQAETDRHRSSQRYSSQQPEEGLSEWEEMDALARLRVERHAAGLAELKWQHARWWRNLNRWMCAVGVVVCVLIIVLAVLGTKRNW